MVTGSHKPLVHDVPQPLAVQSWPHEPQLVGSLVKSTQSLPSPLAEQSVNPPLQAQPQAPLVHVFEAFAGHAAHPPQVAPCVPHSVVDWPEYATQESPSQQPFGHDVESHAHFPASVRHSRFVPHAAHVAPAVPHEVLDSDAHGSHVPLCVQHPFGHDVESQTHCPASVWHSCPEGHAAQEAPPAPHEPLLSRRSGSQMPLLQQPEQDTTPHAHSPDVHASPSAHALHEAPPVPHCWEDSFPTITHVLPLQQPVQPEDVLQTHVPLDVLHVSPVPHPPHVAPFVPQEVFDCCE
jgi:hypothetical protein